MTCLFKSNHKLGYWPKSNLRRLSSVMLQSCVNEINCIKVLTVTVFDTLVIDYWPKTCNQPIEVTKGIVILHRIDSMYMYKKNQDIRDIVMHCIALHTI